MTEPSPLWQLADSRLPDGLRQFVAARREACWSWRDIATDLTMITGVTVSYETLRAWHQRGGSPPMTDHPTTARWVRLAAGSYELRPIRSGRPIARAYRLDGGGWRACWGLRDDDTIGTYPTLARAKAAAAHAALDPVIP